jgi:hypothetical protein
MNINLLQAFRKIAQDRSHNLTIDALISAVRSPDTAIIGKRVWDECHNRAEMAEICSDWPGWPQCSCSCGCDEPATYTDDGGNACCAACAEYTTTYDGETICSRDERTEIITESCGAGNQTRSYVRVKPPVMPEIDEDGEYALYWDTVGNESHVVARFTTRADAEQAVAAKDWPGPSDHTDYLCAYTVRQLVAGEWMPITEE